MDGLVYTVDVLCYSVEETGPYSVCPLSVLDISTPFAIFIQWF